MKLWVVAVAVLVGLVCLESNPAWAESLNPTGLFFCQSSNGYKTQVITPLEDDSFQIVERTAEGQLLSEQTVFKLADPTAMDLRVLPKTKFIRLFRYKEDRSILYYSITLNRGQYVHQILEDEKPPIYFQCEMISPKPSLSELAFLAPSRPSWTAQMMALDVLLLPDLSPIKDRNKSETEEDSGTSLQLEAMEEVDPSYFALTGSHSSRMGHEISETLRPRHFASPQQPGGMEPVEQTSPRSPRTRRLDINVYPPVSPRVDQQPNTLIMSHQRLNRAGLKALAKTIRENPYLEDLRLWDLKLGDRGVKTILRALKNAKQIRNLNLWGNEIGNSGARAIGRFLAKNRSLKTLTLRGNEISDWGFRGILRGLHRGSSLRALDLFGNQVSQRASLAALKAPPGQLFFLNLYMNRIENFGNAELYELRSRLCPENFIMKSLDGDPDSAE